MPDGGVRYFAGIDGRWREVVVHPGRLDIDDRCAVADVSTLPGSDRQHLRIDGRSLSLFARRQGDRWIIELEGRRFEVFVEDERTRHIRELASHVLPADPHRQLRAPMPGLIVRVEVQEGQKVSEGDGLIVMEAMKMENELRADAPGVVTSIAVQAGQAVERDAVLLTLEARSE